MIPTRPWGSKDSQRASSAAEVAVRLGLSTTLAEVIEAALWPLQLAGLLERAQDRVGLTAAGRDLLG